MSSISQKHKKCIGFIDNISCPYNASQNQKCKVHFSNIYVFKRNKKGVCTICNEYTNINLFNCDFKHKYCNMCMDEVCDKCPICQSRDECIN